MALIGSSIGANLVLNYAAKNNVSSVVLISPGLDYQGITTEDAAGGFSKPIFMVASSDDPNESVGATRRLSEIVTTPETDLNMIIYDDAGHGINMLTKHPELQDQIVEWLR